MEKCRTTPSFQVPAVVYRYTPHICSSLFKKRKKHQCCMVVFLRNYALHYAGRPLGPMAHVFCSWARGQRKKTRRHCCSFTLTRIFVLNFLFCSAVVGAPHADGLPFPIPGVTRPGAVYQCPVQATAASASNCQQMRIDTQRKSSTGCRLPWNEHYHQKLATLESLCSI